MLAYPMCWAQQSNWPFTGTGTEKGVHRLPGLETIILTEEFVWCDHHSWCPVFPVGKVEVEPYWASSVVVYVVLIYRRPPTSYSLLSVQHKKLICRGIIVQSHDPHHKWKLYSRSFLRWVYSQDFSHCVLVKVLTSGRNCHAFFNGAFERFQEFTH